MFSRAIVSLSEGCAAYAERFRLSSSVRIWTGFFANGVTYLEAGKKTGR